MLNSSDVKVLLSELKRLKEAQRSYGEVERDFLQAANPHVSGAATVVHVLNGREVVAIGIGRKGHVQKISFSGEVTMEGENQDMTFAKDTDGGSHSLHLMGILPSDTRGWNSQFISFVNELKGLKRVSGVLGAMETRGAAESKVLLDKYLAMEFPLDVDYDYLEEEQSPGGWGWALQN